MVNGLNRSPDESGIRPALKVGKTRYARQTTIVASHLHYAAIDGVEMVVFVAAAQQLSAGCGCAGLVRSAKCFHWALSHGLPDGSRFAAAHRHADEHASARLHGRTLYLRGIEID